MSLPRLVLQYLASTVFLIWMYGLMLVMGILCAPLALWSREGANWVIHAYLDLILPVHRALCGLRPEVRGAIPEGVAIVAAKHQSFLDIFILADALPRPRFVMKESIKWTPILGFYAMRIGCAPVNRGAGGAAVEQMVTRDAAVRDEAAGQTIIYPQGTRVAPGAHRPYKGGVHALAESQGAPVVPVATNAGVFWPRYGVLRRPGLAVVEFLEPLPEGLSRKEMTAALEAAVEPASDRLIAEARG